MLVKSFELCWKQTLLNKTWSSEARKLYMCELHVHRNFGVAAIVTRLWEGWDRVWIPAGTIDFYFFIMLRPALQPCRHVHWVPGLPSAGIRQLGSEADQSSSLVLRLRMSGAIPPLPICLHGMYRENVTFTLWGFWQHFGNLTFYIRKLFVRELLTLETLCVGKKGKIKFLTVHTMSTNGVVKVQLHTHS
jgi:hypothetical protein